jgi:MFS family permease
MEKTSPTTQAPEDALLVNAAEDPHDGEGGPVAGVCEAFMLIWCIPGFGCVSLFAAVLSGGATLAWTFVFPNLETQVWKESAATNTAWMNAGRCLVSVLLCAHFGMWSDKNSRKAAVVIMTVSSLIVGLPVLAFGISQTGLTCVVVLVVITGPFAVHVSGSPVLWAWASDYLGPEHKEVGFAIIGAASSGGSFIVLLSAKAIAGLFPGDPAPFLWITIGCLIVCLGIVAIAPPGAHMPELTDADLAEEKGFLQAMFGPMRLVAKRPTLRAACVVVALLTLPDMAATDISSNIIISLHGYQQDCIKEGHTTKDEITACVTQAVTNTMNVFAVYPRPFTLIVVMTVGVCARRFGPHRLVRVWVPVTALMFAFPMILKYTFETWAITLSGFFVLLPLTNYGPLQALVTHIVHPRQVGEAMGAIATCKNLVSLFAPLIVGGFTSALEKSGHTVWPESLLYLIYPVCAFVMFCAWPFTFCLEKRVPRDTTMTWNTWASAARPSTIRSALNARSSAMFSARP